MRRIKAGSAVVLREDLEDIISPATGIVFALINTVGRFPLEYIPANNYAYICSGIFTKYFDRKVLALTMDGYLIPAENFKVWWTQLCKYELRSYQDAIDKRTILDWLWDFTGVNDVQCAGISTILDLFILVDTIQFPRYKKRIVDTYKFWQRDKFARCWVKIQDFLVYGYCRYAANQILTKGEYPSLSYMAMDAYYGTQNIFRQRPMFAI